MADTARSWAILQALQLRLQGITVANGYRTNAGADVRLERSKLGPGTRITLYSGGTVRGEAHNEREFTLVAEAAVQTDTDDEHELVVAVAEDIEQALDAYLPMPGALPLAFQESMILDSPDGVPAMVAQIMFMARYRR